MGTVRRKLLETTSAALTAWMPLAGQKDGALHLASGGGVLLLRARAPNALVEITLPAPGTDEPPWEATVVARHFLAAVKHAKGTTVALSARTRAVVLGAGGAEIVIPLEPIPVEPMAPKQALAPLAQISDGAALARAVATALPALARDPTIPTLAALALEGDDTTWTAVGSDGNWVCWSSTPGRGSGQVLLRAPDAQLFGRLDDLSGPMAITASEAEVELRTEAIYALLPRLSGSYFQWRKRIPPRSTSSVTVTRLAFAEAIRFVQLGRPDAAIALVPGADETLGVVSVHHDARTEVKAAISGTPPRIVLSAQYLARAIRSTCSGGVPLVWEDPRGPVVVRGEKGSALIMPIDPETP